MPMASILFLYLTHIFSQELSSSFRPLYSAAYWTLRLGGPEVPHTQHVQNPTLLPQVGSSVKTPSLGECTIVHPSRNIVSA